MVYLCFQAVGIAHGTGQHLGDVPESSYVIALKVNRGWWGATLRMRMELLMRTTGLVLL